MRSYLLIALASLATACATSSKPSDAGFDAGSEDGGDAGSPADAGFDAGFDAGSNPYCTQQQLPTAAFIPDSAGLHRGDIAPDFTLPLFGDGGSWQFSTEFTGCDSYVFITDEQTVSSINATALATTTDWAGLIKQSPPNAHYFFISVNPSTSGALATNEKVASQIAAALAGATADQAALWESKLHVVAGNAQSLAGPIGPLVTGWGLLGFAIDRQQRYRGVGFLSDVTRYNQATQSDAGWGYLGNLAYAANEAIYMNAQALTQARLDAEGATVVTLLDGGVVTLVDIDANLPSASDLEAFDTLEVEVTQHCPDPTDLEFNSCGAWDYLASLYVDDPSVPYDPDAGYSYLELARFITSYHRETHWVVDATPMLARLASGGTRHFQWNGSSQPTGTVVDLRLSNRSKSYRPEAILPLWTDPGATFNETYNPDHQPITVNIPADTKHTELWMIITGHGNDANQCCEFCNHEHQFTVNDAGFGSDGGSPLVQFPEAGTSDKCIPEETNGMSPNQGGTWWYGRGGWCPGEQVDPHVYDVTTLVTPGQSATVTMQGKFGDGAPPKGGGGDVDLQSMLVTYH